MIKTENVRSEIVEKSDTSARMDRSQVIIFNERDPSQELNEADSMCRQFKQSRLSHKCAAHKSSVDDCLCILPRERPVSKEVNAHTVTPTRWGRRLNPRLPPHIHTTTDNGTALRASLHTIRPTCSKGRSDGGREQAVGSWGTMACQVNDRHKLIYITKGHPAAFAFELGVAGHAVIFRGTSSLSFKLAHTHAPLRVARRVLSQHQRCDPRLCGSKPEMTSPTPPASLHFLKQSRVQTQIYNYSLNLYAARGSIDLGFGARPASQTCAPSLGRKGREGWRMVSL
ncbi:hypothetical protein QQF64_029970 [Cirrhinus molitorella]|uniref:Uncharacterized protein n=1 Tax=Cirrhinus molitorella TaxID=172907 RepID=A0ABR3N223_9TELE